VNPTLETVVRYRRAARKAATAGAPWKRRIAALLDLAEEARREPDATTRDWAARVIFEEARPLLEDKQPDGPGDGWERAQRHLRAEGLVTCPKCLSDLASDLLLERLDRRRRARIRELEVRERAVEQAEQAAEVTGA
jgi:hypothetical protein